MPISMLARWSGRRLLYLPMNGVQRLIVGGMVSIDALQIYRHWSSLQKIENKGLFVRLVEEILEQVSHDSTDGVGAEKKEPSKGT